MLKDQRKNSKKIYSKYSTVARGLITACNVPPNSFYNYVAKFKGKWMGRDWFTYFCASLYLGAKKGVIPKLTKKFYTDKAWASSRFVRNAFLKFDVNNKDDLKNFVKKAQNPEQLGEGYEKSLKGLDKYLKMIKDQRREEIENKRKEDEKRR